MEVVRPEHNDSILSKDNSSMYEPIFSTTERYTARPINSETLRKAVLNSAYGVKVMNKLCSRHYIVVHEVNAFNNDEILSAIIFVDGIISVKQTHEHKAIIQLIGGVWITTDDPYTDIVRKLFND